jgi:hypothetical protein
MIIRCPLRLRATARDGRRHSGRGGGRRRRERFRRLYCACPLGHGHGPLDAGLERHRTDPPDTCPRPPARLLVFSVHDEAVVIEKAMQSGAGGFISKRSAPEVLLEAVRACCTRRALSQQRRPKKVFEHRSPEPNAHHQRAVAARIRSIPTSCAGTVRRRMCRMLNLSQKTVANYQALIKEKLGVSTSAALVHMALRLGVVSQRSSPGLKISRENFPAIGIFSRLPTDGVRYRPRRSQRSSRSEHPDWRLHSESARRST